ncbi:MAG: 6-bladed beta-propeller, partial [Tannerellaceae bacterium]|jgi:hypothetical protein|nr:6-bladed beta-propeller [Tannerellaceae bacterium]
MKEYDCKYLIAFLVLWMTHCHSLTPTQDDFPVDNVIHLSDAVSEIRPVKLSEIVDTIIFLPLETDGNLIGNRTQIIFADRHVFAGRMVFNLKGKYVCDIGRLGQGPGEGYVSRVVEKKNKYYSFNGQKLVAYDSLGKYAGKERFIMEWRGLDFANAGSNIVVGAGDTVFFLNTNFDLIKKRRVVPPWSEKTTTYNVDVVLRLFSQNTDSVLFYNYINDTIYRVLDDDFSPRWIVDLREEDKVPLKHLLGSEEDRLYTGSQHYTANDLEGWDFLRETDNKIRSFAVYETEHKLIICWLKLREFWRLRNLQPSFLQVAWYDKKTGETVAVDGEGFIDDLSSLGTFYPLCGTHEDYMITYQWPFDLRERVNSLESSGQWVDKNLKELLSSVEDEDNPILIMAHLKQ